MDMKPTAALRLKDSSLRVVMNAVASGEAAGVISAGNSGAMLALAKIVIKTLPVFPVPPWRPSVQHEGRCRHAGSGANVGCDWRNLVEFAVMGEAFAKAVLGLPAPTIGLLNVGAEELKGDESCVRPLTC